MVWTRYFWTDIHAQIPEEFNTIINQKVFAIILKYTVTFVKISHLENSRSIWHVYRVSHFSIFSRFFANHFYFLRYRHGVFTSFYYALERNNNNMAKTEFQYYHYSFRVIRNVWKMIVFWMSDNFLGARFLEKVNCCR